MNQFKYHIFLFIYVFFPVFFADTAEIKFATLAPEGSTWMNVLKDWNDELSLRSRGNLKFRIYPGGVAGDEKDVVRKIRLGQLHAGGFTGVGLGEIAPKVRILDAPFLFKTTKEVDHVTRAFEKDFEDAFSQKGYVLLGWAEVGFVYFFTRQKIESFGELKGLKMWAWEGDPIAEAMFKALSIDPIPLSIADVMTSLQTGLINGVYTSPMGAIALQWTSKTKFMFDFKLANASGAVLISKKIFDNLTQEEQALLLETGKKHLRKLTELSRTENFSAVEFLKKNNILISGPKSGQDAEEARVAGIKAREMLSGKLYDKEFLDKVEKSLNEFRK